MELVSIQKKMKQQLLSASNYQIVDETSFSFIAHTLQVKFNPIIRVPMDLLMKMMLITFKKAPIDDVDLVADILLVEPLFIHDLTKKMQAIGLLTIGDYIQLTPKGEAQLANGIFEDELEETTITLQYSSLHQSPIEGDIEDILEFEAFPEVISLDSEELQMENPKAIIDFIQNQYLSPIDDEQQQYITAYNAVESIQLTDVPCIQFICYDVSADRYFSRIYNCLTTNWDEKLESIVNKEFITSWREKYSH